MKTVDELFDYVASSLCETESQRKLLLSALKMAEFLGSIKIQDTIQKDKS